MWILDVFGGFVVCIGGGEWWWFLWQWHVGWQLV